jgi:ATP/maltotriose-dependent transcriptional regulator MalT
MLWLGESAQAASLAEQVSRLARVTKFEADLIRAAFLQGIAALRGGDFAEAEERLNHALGRTRSINLVDFELSALIMLAELKLGCGRTQAAKALLDEVWEAAELGGYRLQKADALNVLADISLAENNTPAAIDAATRAYQAAWCDGPPYAYHWGLVKAKAHLAALGAPAPETPPFDESKFEPMPEVEINPKDEFWVDPDKLE